LLSLRSPFEPPTATLDITSNWAHTGQAVLDEFSQQSGWECGLVEEGIITACSYDDDEYALSVGWGEINQFLSVGFVFKTGGSVAAYDSGVNFVREVLDRFAPEYTSVWIEFGRGELERCVDLAMPDCFSRKRPYGPYEVMINHKAIIEYGEVWVIWTIHKEDA